MFDMTKKAKKVCRDVLEEGEAVLGSAAVEPPGMVGRAVAASQGFNQYNLIGQAGHAQANSKIGQLAGQLGSSDGMAAGFPREGVLVVTNRRILVYTFNKRKGAPGDFIHQVQRAQVISSTFNKGKGKDDLQLGFVDGTGVAFETGRMAKLGAVAKALNSHGS